MHKGRFCAVKGEKDNKIVPLCSGYLKTALRRADCVFVILRKEL